MKKNLLICIAMTLFLGSNLYAGKKMTQDAINILSNARKSVKSISPKELHVLIEDDKDFVQLDVRENNENGHGEIWSMEKVKLTRGYIEYKIEHKLPNKKTNIVVVCCSGKRAVLAAQTMQKLGYINVSFLEGGVNGWLQGGYPLDTVYGELYLKK